MNAVKKLVVAPALVGVGLSALLISAAPANAADRTNGHYDLEFIPECAGGEVTGGEFEIHSHENDPYGDGDVFRFGGVTEPEVGLAVGWDESNCGAYETDVEVTLDSVAFDGTPSGDSFTAVSGATTVFSASAAGGISADGPITLNAANGYHVDLDWNPTSGDVFGLDFEFEADGFSDLATDSLLIGG